MDEIQNACTGTYHYSPYIKGGYSTYQFVNIEKRDKLLQFDKRFWAKFQNLQFF